MSLLCFFQSSLGKKYVMAITGLVLFIFVIGHMLGNLQIFMGPEQINAYAAYLKSKPLLLWGARFGLLIFAIFHIVTALQLARENAAARPVGYGEFNPVGSSYASRTMRMSGLIVLAFLIYHILHFTLAVPAANFLRGEADFPGADFLQLHDPLGRHDVYSMMIRGFSNIPVSVFYIISMALLCLHLSHGVQSMFQSLGLKNKLYGRYIDGFARATAIIIFVGNISMPIAILLDERFHLIDIFKT
jgi:succinate dehydrogenase / fumarate reductase, cytochrome b subunit